MNINNDINNNDAVFARYTKEISQPYGLGTETKVHEFVRIHFNDGRTRTLCFESQLITDENGVAVHTYNRSGDREKKINDLLKRGFKEISIDQFNDQNFIE